MLTRDAAWREIESEAPVRVRSFAKQLTAHCTDSHSLRSSTAAEAAGATILAEEFKSGCLREAKGRSTAHPDTSTRASAPREVIQGSEARRECDAGEEIGDNSAAQNSSSTAHSLEVVDRIMCHVPVEARDQLDLPQVFIFRAAPPSGQGAGHQLKTNNARLHCAHKAVRTTYLVDGIDGVFEQTAQLRGSHPGRQ